MKSKTSKYETSKKQYESRHRLTWAARYPLKPGRDAASRRGLLVQIADTAISGEYWVSQAKLAERMGLTVRAVRRALAKLVAEGVLRPHRRGFKRTTIYTLMRLGEVAQHGDFLPLHTERNVSCNAAVSERNSTPSQSPPPFERNSTPSRERNSTPSQNGLRGTPRPPKEATLKEAKDKEESSPPRRSDSAAPSSRDAALVPASETAWRLLGAMGGQLPESWLNHQGLKRLIGKRDFEQVRAVIVGIGSNKLPAPAPFFEAYNQHLQDHERGEAELKALSARFPTPKPVNNGNGKRTAA